MVFKIRVIIIQCQCNNYAIIGGHLGVGEIRLHSTLHAITFCCVLVFDYVSELGLKLS